VKLKPLELALIGALNKEHIREWYKHDAVHARIAAQVTKFGNTAGKTREKVQAGLVKALDKCDDPECLTCGYLMCPLEEPMHFHHDGCPAGCGT
jgi:hypothetical protein